MGTYSGFIVRESLGYFTGVDAIAPGLGTPVPQLWGGIAALAGTLDQATPVPMVQAYDGVMVAGSPLDHIFGHLYVSPLSFDVGNLTGATEYTLDIWNANLDDAVCTDVIRTGMEGISVGLDYDGFTLAGLVSLSVPVTFMMDGSPIIDGTLILVFLVGETEMSAQVTFAGRRIVAWQWLPMSTSRPVLTERLEWLTEILTSRTRKEQRRMLRDAPRQSFAFASRLRTDAEAARLETALYGWHGRSWAMPVWAEQVAVDGPLAAGQTGVDVDTTRGDFRQGSMAMLWQSDAVNEVIILSGVMDTRLSFQLPTTVDFAAGRILVMPVRTARIVDTPRRGDHVQGGATFSARFLVSDNTELTSSASAVQYNGEDVLLDALYGEGGMVARDISRPMDVLDWQTGGVWYGDPSGFSASAWNMRWIMKTRDAVWQFRLWLHRRAGRVRPFWMPSWRDADLTLLATVGSTADTMRVADTAYTRLLAGSPTRRHIMVEMNDGTRYLRGIVGGTAGSAGEEILQLSSPFGADVAPASVRRICWLARCRLNADAVEIGWLRAGVATCTVPITEIIDEV